MNSQQQISDSELEIMRIIWKSGGEIRFGPLMEGLEQNGISWKPNTVLTFLTRLAEKGLLRTEKEGRLNIYHALCTEQEYLAGLTEGFLDKVYGGNAKSLVASLLRRERLTGGDIDELRSFWEEAKGDE